jgi:hypothetical protein
LVSSPAMWPTLTSFRSRWRKVRTKTMCDVCWYFYPLIFDVIMYRYRYIFLFRRYYRNSLFSHLNCSQNLSAVSASHQPCINSFFLYIQCNIYILYCYIFLGPLFPMYFSAWEPRNLCPVQILKNPAVDKSFVLSCEALSYSG